MVATVNQCSSESPRINKLIGGTRKNISVLHVRTHLEQSRAVHCKTTTCNCFIFGFDDKLSKQLTIERGCTELLGHSQLTKDVGHFDSIHLFSLSLITERFRQFCFFTKRSTLLLKKSRKINFLHLFFIEQHAKFLPFLLMRVD